MSAKAFAVSARRCCSLSSNSSIWSGVIPSPLFDNKPFLSSFISSDVLQRTSPSGPSDVGCSRRAMQILGFIILPSALKKSASFVLFLRLKFGYALKINERTMLSVFLLAVPLMRVQISYGVSNRETSSSILCISFA